MFDIVSGRHDRHQRPPANRRLQRMAERAARGEPIDPDEPAPAARAGPRSSSGPRDPPPEPAAGSVDHPDRDGSDWCDSDSDSDWDWDGPDRDGAESVVGPAARGGAEPDGPVPRAGAEQSLPRLSQYWPAGGAGTAQRLLAAARSRPLWLLGGVGVLVAIVVTATMLGGSPQPEAAPRLPPAVSAPSAAVPSAAASAGPVAAGPPEIIVSVVGKVASPGLVTLPGDARVADALHAAGGVADGTRITALNLARRLLDGEQLYVGIPVPPGASAAPVPDPSAAGPGAGTPGAVPGAPGGKLDLNTATADQLDELPGIGEVTAQSILDWRAQHGRFSSVGQLNEVDGIGEVRFGELKDVVEVR